MCTDKHLGRSVGLSVLVGLWAKFELELQNFVIKKMELELQNVGITKLELQNTGITKL